jgi:RimJ/RimL family protein N-acetyltransferase
MEASSAAPTVSWPELVVLRDGSEILIRPIERDDKETLARGFQALSPTSRYRRFLTPMHRLSPRLLAYLTEVDHYNHEALVAEAGDDREPVGVARYIRLEDEPDAAELAVAVVDHWQERGVATDLLTRLTERARAAGVKRFRATCLAENRAVLDVLRGLGPLRTQNVGAGVVQVDIELSAVMEHEHPLRVALRRAASGAVVFRHPAQPRKTRAKRSDADR